MNINSQKSILIFLLFVFLSLLYLILIPFGDEPDFWIRARDYVKNYDDYEEWWLPFLNLKPLKLLDFLTSKLNHISQCHVGQNPLEIFTYVDPHKCTQTDKQIFLRLFINSLLILFVLIFINLLKSSPVNRILNISQNKFDNFIISLLFPSYIYFQNLMSNEQIVYLFSIILFLTWERKIISTIIILFITLIDFGSSLFLIFLFISYNILLLINNNRKEVSFKILIICISGIILAYIASYYFLRIFIDYNFFFFSSTINRFLTDIYNHHHYHGFIDKYPILLRPVITYFSFIFFTPGYLKSYILIILSLFFFLHLGYRIYKLRKTSSDEDLLIINENIFNIFIILSCILVFIFLLPAYSNFKYYILLVPFVISSMNIIYSNMNILLILFCSNIFILSNLILYRSNLLI